MILNDGTALGADYALWIPRVKARIDAERVLSKLVLSGTEISQLRSKFAAMEKSAFELLPASSNGEPILLDVQSRQIQDYTTCYELQKGFLAGKLLQQMNTGDPHLVLAMARRLWTNKNFPDIHRSE